MERDFYLVREEFSKCWQTLISRYSQEQLDEWNVNLKPLFNLQKKMLDLFGSDIQMYDCRTEMSQMDSAFKFYCPGSRFPTMYKKYEPEALKIQEKMNKTCAKLLRKADRKSAQDQPSEYLTKEDFLKEPKKEPDGSNETLVDDGIEPNESTDLLCKEGQDGEPVDMDEPSEASENSGEEPEDSE